MPANSKGRRPPAECPVCGEDVPPRAIACPNCGADHGTGWKDDAMHEAGLDLPDDDFDYDQFVEREFGSGKKREGLSPLWMITGIVLLIALAWAIFRG